MIEKRPAICYLIHIVPAPARLNVISVEKEVHIEWLVK